MRFRATSAFLATLLATLLATSPGWADKPDAVTKPEAVTMAEAKQRFNEGMKFADDGNHEAARLKFSQAWVLLKSPAILYNLARSEQLSGHSVEALEHYRLFGKMSSDPKVTEVQKQRALENIAKLSEMVGQIDIEAPTGATLSIDGQPVEWTSNSDPIPVVPGKHEVTATVEGNKTSVTVDAAPGTVAKARLKSAAPAPPSSTPPPPPTNVTPQPEPKSAWTAGRIAGVAIAVGGLAAVGTGVFFHFDSSSAGDDAEKKARDGQLGSTGCRSGLPATPPACKDLGDLRDREESSAVLRNAFWIGGGAMVIGGAALFLLTGPRSPEKTTAWHVLPRVSHTSGGIEVIGRF